MFLLYCLFQRRRRSPEDEFPENSLRIAILLHINYKVTHNFCLSNLFPHSSTFLEVKYKNARQNSTQNIPQGMKIAFELRLNWGK